MAALAAAALAAWLAVCLPGAAGVPAAREERDQTPTPCQDVRAWVDRHLDGARGGHQRPHMLLLLGGSGAGKSSFVARWRKLEDESPSDVPQRISHFVRHGLDEYLEYIPEYAKTIADSQYVYRDAADACYPGAAIPAAKVANGEIIARKIHLIYEETGKNLDRIKKRVLPPFLEAGYSITVVLVDNSVDVAIARAAGRFQTSGRYASDEYIRGTFSGSVASYDALRATEGVVEAVYCDNSDEDPMRCYADSRPAEALVPAKLLAAGLPQRRRVDPNPSSGEL